MSTPEGPDKLNEFVNNKMQEYYENPGQLILHKNDTGTSYNYTYSNTSTAVA